MSTNLLKMVDKCLPSEYTHIRNLANKVRKVKAATGSQFLHLDDQEEIVYAFNFDLAQSFSDCYTWNHATYAKTSDT